MKKINLFEALKAKGVALEDAEKKMLDELSGEINTALEAVKSGTMSADDFEQKKADLLKGVASEQMVTDLKTAMEAQGLAIKGLTESGAGRGEDMSIRAQVESYFKTNKAAIDSIKSGSAAQLPAMQIKAAATMTVAGVNSGSSVFLPRAGVAPGVNDLNRTKPTFWNRLTKGRTNLNPYVWVNKTNKQGNATFIAEGVLKPLASFELTTESSVPKKVAERMKASTELLYDVDGMTSMIENELRFEVEVAANTATLTGTGSSTSPAGITTLAAAYTLTTVKTTTPNNLDAIRASVVQLRLLNFDRDIMAFISPVDAANMDLAKGADGHYILPPFTTSDGQSIKGVSVIEDNNIAVGRLLIGDMTKYKILMYQDFFVQWGWENDDFSKNLVTVIGEMRFHQFFGANDAGAFIYDTFANIKTAITAS